MNLLEKIEKDFKESLLKKDKIRLSTLRLLKSALKNKEIELRPQKKEPSEEEVIGVIKKEIKKRKEAIEFYEKGKRSDLVLKEKEELKILEKYLPEEISPQELRKIIQRKIEELASQANFGRIIGEVMKEVSSRAEGKVVAEIVKEELESRK